MVGSEPNRAVGSGRTRELLLDTAERLFAERGIHGVSLREIGLAANQRNNGVTQYHFGDKAGLVRAVFERRAVVVNDRRVHLLDEMRPLHRSSMTELVGVFVDPLSEQVELGNWYVPFLSRLNAEHERDELLQPVSEDLNTGFVRVRRELRRRASRCTARRPVRQPPSPGRQPDHRRARRSSGPAGQRRAASAPVASVRRRPDRRPRRPAVGADKSRRPAVTASRQAGLTPSDATRS